MEPTLKVEPTTLKLFAHLINRQIQSVQTKIIDTDDSLTISECTSMLQDKTKIAMNNIECKATLDGGVCDGQASLKSTFGPNSDLYIFYDGIKPVIKQEKQELVFESLTKYAFIDDKNYVKVYLTLEGIGNVPDQNIHSRFLDRSFEIRIMGYHGKNWIFAVPKTQCTIKVKNSKVIKKADKLVIQLGKIADSDNWFSLYKVKCIGEKDDA